MIYKDIKSTIIFLLSLVGSKRKANTKIRWTNELINDDECMSKDDKDDTDSNTEMGKRKKSMFR